MIEYVSIKDIADWFGVGPPAVHRWRSRHPDFPKPDAVIGQRENARMFGWLPEREIEIREWHANRDGQGARTDLKGRP